MRNRRLALIFAASAILLAAALLTSCSSAPKQTTDSSTEVKNRAAEATEFGNSYYRQGRYDLALGFFSQALAYNLSVDNRGGAVQSYNSIGRTRLALDQVAEAEQSFLAALAIAREQGGEPLFVTSNNLGELYLRQGDPAKALATFQRLVEGPTTGIPPGQVALAWHNLGAACKATGDLVQAMSWLEKSLAINLAQKLNEEAAGDYYMIASVYSKQGDFPNARKYAGLALELDKRIENSPGIVKDLHALGLIEARAGDHDSAYGWFQRSYLAAAALGWTAEMRQALQGLISSGEALGRTAEVAAHREALAELERQ